MIMWGVALALLGHTQPRRGASWGVSTSISQGQDHPIGPHHLAPRFGVMTQMSWESSACFPNTIGNPKEISQKNQVLRDDAGTLIFSYLGPFAKRKNPWPSISFACCELFGGVDSTKKEVLLATLLFRRAISNYSKSLRVGS